MARIAKQPPDSFTAPEIEAGASLTARTVEFLVGQSIAPRPVIEGKRGKGPSLWNSTALARFAVIGAAGKAGIELVLAARLVSEIADELESAYGNIPAQLENCLPRGELDNLNSDDQIKLLGDDFWLHNLIRKSTQYRPEAAIDHDFMMEIVDRRYVFTGYLNLPAATPIGGQEMEAAFKILNWEKGAETAEVRHVNDFIGYAGAPEAAAKAKIIEQEFQSARRNAVGLIRINISLAVRNALDRIAAFREVAGLSFDWKSTIVPKPGRYDGCDEKGRPLDPEHPWNKSLPPLERARRLVEIEEYIANREAKRRNDSS